MAKLSGWRKLRKWVRIGNDFKRTSTEMIAESVLMSSGDTLETTLGGLSFVSLTQSEYDALKTKDSNTIYFTT